MSDKIQYGNLEFMYSNIGDYIQSVFGDKNFKSRVFSGAKLAGPILWGWQFKQFPHADSDFKTVYLTRRFTYTNTFNGATAESHQTYRAGFPEVPPAGSPLAFTPSESVFNAGPGSGTISVAGFDPPTSPHSRPVRLSQPTRYTAVQTLEDAFPMERVFSVLRSAITNPPDPDYEDLSGPNLYQDQIFFRQSDWATTRIAKQGNGPGTQVPYLVAYISAEIQGNIGSQIGQYYRFFAAKVGITILNTFVNAITKKKYCGDSWKFERTLANPQGTFSERNNCRMVVRGAGPEKVVIVVPLPANDPDVDTGFVKQGAATANQLYMPPIPEDLNTPRPGYPAQGYSVADVNGLFGLPPPGACCDLTP